MPFTMTFQKAEELWPISFEFLIRIGTHPGVITNPKSASATNGHRPGRIFLFFGICWGVVGGTSSPGRLYAAKLC